MASATFDPARDATALDALAAQLGTTLEPTARGTLLRYAELVAQWSRRTDLVSARDPRALAEVSFLDALVLAGGELVPEGARAVDVGAGAGAPALPLLALRPDLRVTLVEPRRKRVAFLRTAIGALDLASRAGVVETRVAPGAKLPGVPFDVALSRATFAPAEWLGLGLELAPRVVVLCAAEPAPDDDRAERLAERRYEVPSSGAPRAVYVFRRR